MAGGIFIEVADIVIGDPGLKPFWFVLAIGWGWNAPKIVKWMGTE